MFIVSYVLWDKNAKNAIPLYPLKSLLYCRYGYQLCAECIH